MECRRISQRDVAERAKVHFSTVSLALRDSPHLSEEMRQRIQRIAREMGYRPDPMLGALQSYRKIIHSPRYQGVIGWINTFPVPSELYWGGFVEDYRKGARARCEELGYKLEEFNLSEIDIPRLSKILYARRIQGLLFPPQPESHPSLGLDWKNFSAVAFGYSLREPSLHLVTNAQYRASRMSVRIMREHGYRRIGFVISKFTNERTDRNFAAGFLAEQMQFTGANKIPILIIDEGNFNEERKHFKKWYKRYRPDAILALYGETSHLFKEEGIHYSDCGLLLLALDVSRDKTIARIDQNDVLIGRTAVDYVAGMIQRNERGVPNTPLRILVESVWTPGISLPGRPVERPDSAPTRASQPRQTSTIVTK